MANGKILVTGFGPFGSHSINASWETVRLLPKEIDGFQIIVEEVPVSYDAVDSKILYLWQVHQPQLVIHVGVSSFTDKITLETCANKQGYYQKDILGNNTRNFECSVECQEVCIKSSIDFEDICDRLNQTKTKACISTDAGRYLCEYIFYTSLSVDKTRTMFIHVPTLGNPYTAEELASGIEEVIRCVVKQLIN